MFFSLLQRTDPKNVNIVAIYTFQAGNIPALLACAKARIQ
jgi:hypothetical protein